MKSSLFLFLFTTFSHTLIYSQSFKEKIESIYSFKIADLQAVDLEKKYKQLDAFWQELNADSTTYLPMIRKELQKTGYSSYFYFDMSSYLEMKSTRKKDLEIVENALKNITWTDISTWELVEKMREFALSGINITEVTFQLLKQEKIKLTDPDSKEVFNQGKLLAYLLLPLKTELYSKKMDALFDSSTPESQRSIVTLFWMTNTNFGKTKLEEIAVNKRKIAVTIEVKSYADRLLRRFSPLDSELLPYNAMTEEQRKIKLTQEYKRIVMEWDTKSWDKLILTSKLMHHFQIVLDENVIK